jgi:DNA helicase II / ATP-dependent DNA helicase PcrA
MQKSNKEFQAAYTGLNKEQKAAVDTLDGPVMVVAGPGTGKTQTIALRVANILLKTDTDPDAVLALTYTESAAKEMRTRLTSFIGHTAYYVNVATFHGFCVDVIRDNPGSFSIDPAAEPLSDLGKIKLFRGFLDRHRWHDIRPVNAPYHYVRSLIAGIADLKREGVEPDAFGRVLESESDYLVQEGESLKKSEFTKRKRDLAKNIELLEMYRLYQKALLDTKQFDFEDMIGHVTRAFRDDPDLLRAYQERFHYFLVDEYQDTNSAQNQVVKLLASFWGARANVFVVGDPDQSIYRFQGASLENLLGFVKDFPGCTVITLRDNYRSAQAILDSAHSLITHNELRIDDVVPGVDPHLRAAKVREKGELHSIVTASSLSEDIYLAGRITSLISSGISPREIVVIYRNNADGPPLGRTLAKFGVDYVVQGGGNVLAEPVVQRLLKIFRVIHEIREKKDDPNLFTILHYDIFGIDPLDVLKISRQAADRRATLFDVMTDPKLLGELDLATQDQVEAVLTSLGEWQDIDANSTFTEFFEKVLTQSGYLNSVLNGTDVHNNISRLNTLFTEVKKMNVADHHLNLAGFLGNLDLMEQNNLRIEESGFAQRDDAITLTTAHSAKGLEWEHVFVYRVYDGQWGNKRNSDLFHLPSALLPNTDLSKKEKNEDERRLFYVALTRAKTHLHLTRAAAYSQYGRSRDVVPSMFMYELGDDVKELALSPQKEDEIAANLTKILEPQKIKPATSTKMDVEEESFLRGLVDKFELSVTALNAYLECPYRFKLNNLLRVPRAKAPHMAFGTAVHAALESFYRELKDNGAKKSKEFLLGAFELALKNEILTVEEEGHRLEQGKKILSAYYDYFAGEFAVPAYLEHKFHVKWDDIKLTGAVDRMDILDQDAKSVRVVDYKTGKVKTKGQIMGTTADSSGGMHRQLVFYKLLMDLDRRLTLKFGEAELDFVQAPADLGKSGKHRFSVSDAEVGELKQVITEVMTEIRALHFPRTSDLSICASCDFRDHCYPSGLPAK